MSYVLVAEDDPAIARLLGEDVAGLDDVETEVIMNGALVPDALAARQPDLLILDVALPGLSGLDIFDLIRNDARWQGVPVLFLTGSPEKAQAAFATTGVHRVMAKPFDMDALVTTIRQMLSEPRQTEVAA